MTGATESPFHVDLRGVVDLLSQVATVVRAEDFAVLNAGYAYDRTILERGVPHTDGLEAHRLDLEHLADGFTDPDLDDEALFAPLLDLQRVALEALDAHALLAGRHPLTPFGSALVARALPALIDRAVDGGPA